MNAAQRQRILLIEDDAVFAEECSQLLCGFGYEVRITDTLVRLDELITFETFDIILLDQFVGRHNAITLIRRIRRIFDGALIIISNNTEIVDQIIALESGADDFIQKLQPSREIVARIRSVMRRISLAMDGASSSHAPMHADHSAQEGVWQLSHRSRTLMTPTGARVALSSAEFDLLVFLATRRDRPVSRDEISQAVFHRPHAGATDRTVDILLSRLRRSLMPYLDSGNAVRSLRGMGYVFVGFDMIQTDSPPRVERRVLERVGRRGG